MATRFAKHISSLWATYVFHVVTYDRSYCWVKSSGFSVLPEQKAENKKMEQALNRFREKEL